MERKRRLADGAGIPEGFQCRAKGHLRVSKYIDGMPAKLLEFHLEEVVVARKGRGLCARSLSSKLCDGLR